MKPLDDFLPQILPYAPGCPVPVAYDHIRSAAIRFSERTRMWRESGSFAMAADGTAIVVSDGAELFEIESAKFEGTPLDPIAISVLNDQVLNWETADTGRPAYITQTTPNEIRVVPYAVGDVEYSVFIKPSEDCVELPDWMVSQFRRCIADGALSEILILPGQNFSDPARAGFFEARFLNELDRLSNQNIRGQQRASARAKAYFM